MIGCHLLYDTHFMIESKYYLQGHAACQLHKVIYKEYIENDELKWACNNFDNYNTTQE